MKMLCSLTNDNNSSNL
jgi:hypothetical protein